MARVSVKWGRGGAYNGEIRKIKFVDEQTMLDAGNWLAVQLENRAGSGRDEAGSRFKPYSARYAAWKGVSRTAVNLRLSGDMWRSFGALWATRNKVRIGFAAKAMEARARYNEQLGRKFLGVEPKWLTEIRRRIATGIRFDR